MKPVFIVLTTLVIALLAPGVAVAQESTNETDITISTSDDDEDHYQQLCKAPEMIDEATALCHSEIADDGRAVLVIDSEKTQFVTVTDAASFMSGGDVPRKRVQLDEGYNTVRFPVTHHKGFAGVSVDTGGTLYAIPLENDRTLIGGPWTSQDAQLAAIGGASSVGLVSIVLVIRRITGRSTNPERIA